MAEARLLFYDDAILNTGISEAGRKGIRCAARIYSEKYILAAILQR